jgi:hypothetical protein
MKHKIITICLLFVAIFLSCKKEELGILGNSGNVKTPLLSRILIDNQCSNEYAYTDSNLISEIKSQFDFTMNHYNNLGQLVTTEYYTNDDILSSDNQVSTTAINSSGLVTAESGNKSGIITYVYNDKAQLIKTTYTLTSLASTEYSEFTYDSNNRIARQTMYWDNTASGYIDYSYDGNGNMMKEMLFNMPSTGVAELITTTNYTFDNKANPYKLLNGLMIPGINTNRNNIVKETNTIHISQDQGPDKVQIAESSYKYNTLGYPISKNDNISFVYE